MSKKKKSRYIENGTKVVKIGEKITFDKNMEGNHMAPEWFYLNDITWFKAIDGRIVAPIKGVVTHLGRPRGYVGPIDDFAPRAGCRAMYVSTAEQCIVDVAPFGKCYEKRALESLWDSLHGHDVECAPSTAVKIPEVDDTKGREIYTLKDSVGDENTDVKFKHGGLFDLPVKEVKDCTDDAKSGENEGQFVNLSKISEVSGGEDGEEPKNG